MPRFRNLLVPGLALFAGLLLVLEPLFLSAGRAVPGGLGDTRLVHFSLEHAHRFLQRQEPHRHFWDPPIFYPARNVAAYTDTMVSFVPFYSPWRVLGLAPDTAFQLWLLIVWSLTFLSFYFFLRQVFPLGAVASAAGSFLFAFGSSRSANIVHPQLTPHFYLVVALWALFRIFALSDSGAEHRSKLRLWIVVFFSALVLQAYAAFYPLFFLGLFLGLALLGALCLSRSRLELKKLLKNAGPTLLAAALLSAAVTAPLVQRYLQAAQDLGLRRWRHVEIFLPRVRSWFLMGHDSWLYGWVHDTELGVAAGTSLRRSTHYNGLGVATLVLVLIGLYHHRRRFSVRLMVLACGIAIVVTTLFPGGFTFWRYLFDLLPAAGAVRAVGRIGLFLLIPAGLGLAFFFEAQARRKRVWPLVVAALLVVVEQRQRVTSYDKFEARRRVEAVAAEVEPHCLSFFVSTVGRRPERALHEDAIWAATLTGVPTVNGVSGNTPPGWRPFRIHRRRRDRKMQATIENDLARWIERNGLDPKGVCWIELKVPHGAASRAR